MEPLLASFKRKRSGGSKPLLQRTILAEILYKCRRGCQWAMLPACDGSKNTVHEHFQRWNKAGVMVEIFRIFLAECGEKVGVDAQWQAMDGTLLQAPKHSQKTAAECLGRNPTDRGRSGGKLHPM
ncbi:transposase [uncultured Desulfovibrio sp.]|uniref:transposase n=1 Tax=uncultured Desulfovibrio sp. TaxID=167968 RepID=UPI00342B4F0F